MENIHIKNPSLLAEKIIKIKKDGINHLHVVSDFDRTLTPAFHNGKVSSGFELLRTAGYLPTQYVEESYALKEIYYPIEINESLSLEVRSAKMREWWQAHLDIMIKYGLHQKYMDEIISRDLIKARPESFNFYTLLHQQQIPLLIFSAGLGDLITGFLKKQHMLFENMHIIANFFSYNSDGLVTGFKSNIIHSLNKNEKQVVSSFYYHTIKNKKNVLLLGDSLGDIHMSEGLVNDTIVCIGFLNDNMEKLNAFSQVYDVVILNDGSMDYVNQLLEEVVRNEQ